VSAPGADEGVTTLELFFDLAFVFAVTQLTGLIVGSDGATGRGVVRALDARRVRPGDPGDPAGESGGRPVTTAGFIALAERESGRSLDAFFSAWLTQPGKPLTR